MIEVLPYARGVYGRDTLYRLWEMVEVSGDAQRLFYAQQCPDESWRGDLVEFVRYFELDTVRRYLFMPYDRADEKIMGLVWFDDVQPRYSGCLSVFYLKRYRGKKAQEATRQVLQYAFDRLGYSVIWGFTPYRDAVLHGKAAGLRKVAVLPGLAKSGQDIYVMQREK